ncbi:MAG: hypothetical protein JO306_16515 [Gemmatimonadetes bacterium]|nr:hypothetical protein [Gemmatimonadota bacterium]
MADSTHPEDRSLREIAERDRHIAGEAAHEAELERPVAAGAPDHPHPDIAAADHLRARDDVRTFTRQAQIARDQAHAAEAIEDTQRRLHETGEMLARVREDVSERAGDVRALEGDARDLREQTGDVHDAARGIQPPDVQR